MTASDVRSGGGSRPEDRADRHRSALSGPVCAAAVHVSHRGAVAELIRQAAAPPPARRSSATPATPVHELDPAQANRGPDCGYRARSAARRSASRGGGASLAETL